MKRILFTALVTVQPVVVGWLLGADYSTRGFDAGFTYVASAFAAWFVGFGPWWDEK